MKMRVTFGCRAQKPHFGNSETKKAGSGKLLISTSQNGKNVVIKIRDERGHETAAFQFTNEHKVYLKGEDTPIPAVNVQVSGPHRFRTLLSVLTAPAFLDSIKDVNFKRAVESAVKTYQEFTGRIDIPT
jgi:hypothetical protein